MQKGRLLQSLILMMGFALITLAAQPAHALIQLRASYGLNTVKPDQIGSYPTLSKLTGFSADLIVSPPLFPFAFGVRHEILGAEESNSYGKLSVDMTRTSALVSFRLIDTLIFVGAIGSYGLSHGGDQTLEISGGGKTTADIDTSGSYSIGVEAGMKLVGFLVGAEVGYLGLEIGEGANKQKLDGAYTKVHVGLDF
ncbi:MAG: hypothetical protein H6624_10235 [Bdellovibrionaceae bacterium]|nr:hypothetical protein [Bdellovibrionales bacterium]MCB9084712.1 hypothetical protein [Pseudobdellovibrionaceae bacterium]